MFADERLASLSIIQYLLLLGSVSEIYCMYKKDSFKRHGFSFIRNQVVFIA